MYTAIYLAMLAAGFLLMRSGILKRQKNRIVGGVLVILFGLGFFGFMSFWGEVLWFEAVGYEARLWKAILARIGALIIGGLVAGCLVSLLMMPIGRYLQFSRWLLGLVGLFLGAIWGLSNWEIILKYLNREGAGFTEPILEQDAGFYMFTLPFLDQIYHLLFIVLIVALAGAALSLFVNLRDLNNIQVGIRVVEQNVKSRLYNFFYTLLGLLLLLLAFGKWLNRFHLLYSERGAVTGPGWTDVNILLPALYIVMALTAFMGLVMMLPFLRKAFQKLFKIQTVNSEMNPLMACFIIIAAAWFIGLVVIPEAYQWLRVEPNEISYEAPYIENNIEHTRFGYNLHNMQEERFGVGDTFNQSMVDENPGIFENIRLWDWRALDAVHKQFQEIRLYYEFLDVDIDRYEVNGDQKQVMVSAREMRMDNLPEKSRTFVNRRFKYTHGYGITMTDVSEFTEEGLPNMLIKDLPPESQFPELAVQRPEIYYGELTKDHVIANSSEQEFDYPKGDENAYNHYDGDGGVELSNAWRRFLYGWKFDGTRFFLSGYPQDSSRMMFHRNIQNRLEELAPFIKWDKDPYVVLSEGKIYWMIDGYTTSSYMPYSKHFSSFESIEYKEGQREREIRNSVAPHLSGVNYVRNSVKAVVNAYTGEVDFYQYDQDDPVIDVYKNIYPNLIQEKEAMPQQLENHVRYPVDYFLVQSLIYSKYHMEDPDVFYNQEDLWTRATEKYYEQLQAVDPYYVMWERPGSDQPEFTLMMPFTPKNRQVAIGWVAGSCDPEHYGEYMAYKFPKEKRILGPQQVETKIDQNQYLSEKLTLWDQRGSRVIRGNVLAIPVNNTLFYVEPIYLQSETAAYPELRLVVVMFNDQLSFASNFDEALKGLLMEEEQEVALEEAPDEEKEKAPQMGQKKETLILRAKEAFDRYLELTGKKRFEEASKELDKLEQNLNQLTNDSVKLGESQ